MNSGKIHCRLPHADRYSGRISRSVLTVCLLAVLTAFASPSSADDAFQRRFESNVEDAWSSRGDLHGLVSLLRAESLETFVGDASSFGSLLSRLAADPQTLESTRARATSMLSWRDLQAGRLEEAEKWNVELGYLQEWIVIGPFPDENKEGFDKAYPPESSLDFGAEYEGKGHTVSWRRVPPLPGRWVVPLGTLLDPVEGVAGYAATFVRVSKNHQAVLRGGFNEAFKIWVNGDVVSSTRVYSGRTMDQFSVPCTLKKGWNVILVKVCNRHSGWNFTLRLTDARGKTLEGWAATSDPLAVDKPLDKILKNDGGASPNFQFHDPERELQTRAQAGEAGALADYGLYLLHSRSFDRSEQKEVRALQEALAVDPDRMDLWMALAEAQEDHNLSRKALQTALDRRPADPEVLYEMASYYSERGMALNSLQTLERALESDPENVPCRVLRSRLRMQYPTDTLAEREIAAIAGQYPDSGWIQLAHLQAARTTGKHEEQFAIVESYWRSHQGEAGAWADLIRVLRDVGQTQRAEELSSELMRNFPFQVHLVAEEVLYRLLLNQPEKAHESLAPVLEWSPEWAEGRKLMGDILLAMGRSEEGMAEYQQSLLLKPQQEDLKRKLFYLSPEEEGFEKIYRVGAQDIPEAVDGDEGEQVAVLLDNTVVEVQPSGLSSRYTQRVVQILATGALRRHQYHPITYDPGREEIRILDAFILKPGGYKVHAESYVTDLLSQPRYRLYYRTRNLVLSFPSLEVGDQIWIEYKISDIAEANEYGRYFGWIEAFGEVNPVLMKQFTLIVPEGLSLHIREEGLLTSPIVMVKDGKRIHRWIQRDLQRIRTEPDMQPLLELVPYLHISTFEDWDSMGRWYAAFIQDQWELTPEIKAQVASLVEGKTTVLEKVRAIHRWVVQQTRYVGLEFGVHGYKPYKVSQIFERRFGDCKDKAILLAAMLREASVDSCMVLVRTRNRGEIAPEPASLAVFNHAICYVPELDLFLDGTAEYSGMKELPRQDRGVWVLQVWPDGKSRRVQIPEMEASNNRYEAHYEITVGGADLDAPFENRLRFQGEECSWVRRRYQDPDKQVEMLEKDLSRVFPGTKLETADFGDLTDINSDVTVRIRGVLGRIVKPDGGGWITLPTWMGNLELTNRMAALSEREWPLLQDFPWVQGYEVTYTLPEGAEVEELEPVDYKTPFGSLTRTQETRDGEVRIFIQVEFDVLEVEPDEYPAFREFCTQADTYAGQRLRVLLNGEGR